MKYRKGYKYQLVADEFFYQTGIKGYTIETDFIVLTPAGEMLIRKRYAWDGSSGPTYDSKNSMRASAAHDALYQLMRMRLLPRSKRFLADYLLDRILKEDGMWKVRRWYWVRGVEWFAYDATNPDNIKLVETAP